MTRHTYSVLMLALAAAGFSAQVSAQMDHNAHTMPAAAKPAATSGL